MIIISTLKSNRIFRANLMLAFFVLTLMIVLLVSGHFIVGNIVREKFTTVDLSNPITQKRYNRLMSDYKNFREERELLKTVRMPKDNVVTLVQYFDEIALKSSVKQTVGVVTDEEDKNSKKYNITTVRYKINVAGEFSAINNYLANLMTSPFFLRMESFDVVAPNENSLTEDYLATISIVAAIKE